MRPSMLNVKHYISFALFHLEAAAFFAMADLRSGVKAFFRAGPPFFPISDAVHCFFAFFFAIRSLTSFLLAKCVTSSI